MCFFQLVDGFLSKERVPDTCFVCFFVCFSASFLEIMFLMGSRWWVAGGGGCLVLIRGNIMSMILGGEGTRLFCSLFGEFHQPFGGKQFSHFRE